MNKYEIELIKTIRKKDPSIHSDLEVKLLPGYKALNLYKISRYFYLKKQYFIARYIMEYAKRKTGIEIHPGAQIGENLFIDHGMGVVIGETSIVGNNVVMYHGVTLGAVKNTKMKRHPTIEDNVMIGTGAKILGDIIIGTNAKIGAGAVVLKDVPSDTTAIGIPAKILKKS